MAELAKEIVLTHENMEIDGTPFPWYMTEKGAQPSGINRRSLTYVTVEIPCERIVVQDTPWGSPKEEKNAVKAAS
jgi:hypothetical protein